MRIEPVRVATLTLLPLAARYFAPSRTIEIELLALDLATCGRCTGTDRNLEESLAPVANVLRETGAAIKVTKRVIATAPEADRFRFVSSPTIRVDGSDLSGCRGGVDCRVWIWRGKEYLEAPRSIPFSRTSSLPGFEHSSFVA